MSFFEEYVLGATEYVKVQWDSPDDLEVSGVQMAFVEPGTTPEDVDFKAATWIPEPEFTNRSRYLLDTEVYGPGFFVVWGKLVDSPETVIRPFGMIRIV